MNKIKCDKCGGEFTLTPSGVFVITEEDLRVTYFTCPMCNSVYNLITTDTRMRELFDERKKLERLIAIEHSRQFRRKTVNKHLTRLGVIKKEQIVLAEDLKAKGNEILAKHFGTTDEEHPTEQS